ncbi:MAG: ATP-dependent sacrificial sulfur transferase LarE [Candidatus Omnitrophica bacterium]|nr:ATP-dependent sacrificial sulfur transferase LarE [Candidatus Omnitrophota bacterium]
MILASKISRLNKALKRYGSVLIAFSGGVDSTFLLSAASRVLPKDKLLAVTADSPTYSKEELAFSKKIARCLGVRHKVIHTGELDSAGFTANKPDRCYFCKKELFGRLKEMAAALKLNFVADASNISDKKDFRPGAKAVKELKICSPLQEAGLTKNDIRRLSRKMGLPTWDKPSLACLASRVPYGTRINPADLSRIDKAEKFIRSLGFKQVRVRHYGDLARIEVEKRDIKKLVAYHVSRITKRLRKLGYKYITVDLEGYRAGSLNETIK